MDNLVIWCLFLVVVGVYVVDDYDVEIVEFYIVIKFESM